MTAQRQKTLLFKVSLVHRPRDLNWSEFSAFLTLIRNHKIRDLGESKVVGLGGTILCTFSVCVGGAGHSVWLMFPLVSSDEGTEQVRATWGNQASLLLPSLQKCWTVSIQGQREILPEKDERSCGHGVHFAT